MHKLHRWIARAPLTNRRMVLVRDAVWPLYGVMLFVPMRATYLLALSLRLPWRLR
jgi:hypothetical protein